MCGIVSVISKNAYGLWGTHASLFNQMLVCDSVRGPDSTGVFGVNLVGNVDYLKTAANPFDLLHSEEYRKFNSKISTDYAFIVGHNRRATIGKITDECAHPFQESHIILVHNGTLNNHKSLTENEVEVDSHAITHAIAEKGYKEALKEIDGAFALVWYDAKDKCLRFVRNDKRPLSIVETDTAYYLASEATMMNWLLGRDNTKITSVTDVEPEHVYSFDLDKPKTYGKEKVELYSPPKPVVVPSISSKASTEKQQKPGGNTDAGTLQAGQVITCHVTDINTYKKEWSINGHTYTGFIRGAWVSDEAVVVTTFCTADEMDEILESETNLVVVSNMNCSPRLVEQKLLGDFPWM